MGFLHHWIEDEEEEEAAREKERQRKIDAYYEDCPLFGPKATYFDKDGNPIW